MPRHRKYPLEPCKHCGSMNTSSCGVQGGSLRRKCRDCKRSYNSDFDLSKITDWNTLKRLKGYSFPEISRFFEFIDRGVIEKKWKKKIRKRYIEKMRVILNIHNVGNVPCFFCVGEKPNNCIESCEDLENFLTGGLQK